MKPVRNPRSADGMNSRTVVRVDPELADLIPGFLMNRRSDMRTIERALGTRDFDLIKRVGHVMKGAGAGYGFDAITELGDGIEHHAEIRNTKGIRDALVQLADYLDRLKVIYE